MNTKTNYLGEMLKELRTAHSYTQDYVASAIGVVRQTYSHYETGRRVPDVEALYKLAGLYSVPVEDLMHLSFSNIDRVEYYYAPEPTDSSVELDDYISFLNTASSKQKLQLLTEQEKKLLYYFSKIADSSDRQELIDIARLKAAKYGKHKRENQ